MSAHMFRSHGALALIDPHAVSRIVVFGDVHGDLDALRSGIRAWGERGLLVFLGDYADRGPNGVEVIETLNGLLTRHPGLVVALKGNHEDYDGAGDPRFTPCTLIHEAELKRGSWRSFLPVFRSLERRLHAAALLPGFALFVHGGIGPAVTKVEDLTSPTSDVLGDLLWSDPGTARGAHASPRGAGTLFGPDVSARVLGSLGVRTLIRSHQPTKAHAGPQVVHGRRVVTTSSTSVYGGRPFVLDLDVAAWPRSIGEIEACVRFLD